MNVKTMTNRQLEAESIDRIDNLTYEPLERKYMKVQFADTLIIYMLMMSLALLLLFIEEMSFRYTLLIVTESILAVAAAINLMLIPKAVAFKGFAVREHDITYRSGIIFPSVTTVPFRKIQQVSIRQTPASRIMGLYSVSVSSGAQTLSEIRIPGLTGKRANEIKTLITEHIKDGEN